LNYSIKLIRPSEHGGKLVGRNRKMQLSQFEEWREKSYHSAKIYKERTKIWHHKRIEIKEFTPGDKVLLFNSRVKLFGQGMLRRKWQRPYTVTMLHHTEPSPSKMMKVRSTR
jgi:hypothetical protein